jgi:molybdenum transport protein
VLGFPSTSPFDEPLAETVARPRRAAPEKKLVIEATSIADAMAAAAAGFDVVQAEKMSPQQVGELVAALGGGRRAVAPRAASLPTTPRLTRNRVPISVTSAPSPSEASDLDAVLL